MKILVTNTVVLNGGDAAILLSIINLLRSEFGQNTEFIIYDSQPEIASKYYSDLNFRKLLHAKAKDLPSMNYLGQTFLGRVLQYILKKLLIVYSRIHPSLFYLAAWCWTHRLQWVARLIVSQDDIQDLEHYSSADLIVSTGGTYLVENYSLNSRIYDYKISLLMGNKLVFYTQSLGPFKNKDNQKIFRHIFNHSLLILLRDEASLKHLQDIKVHGKNIHVSSDVVFALENSKTLTENIDAQVLNKTFPKIIISVRYWHLFKHISPEVGMQKYKSALLAVTQYLVEQHQAEVTYLSTCQGIPEYWTDDSKFATEIFESLPISVQQHVKVDSNFHTPELLVKLLSDCNFVIATRMHMCILSLIAGTPVIPIAYEFKTKELFNRLNFGQWVQDIENIDAESLVATSRKFLLSLSEIKQNLNIEVENESKRALDSGTIVKKYFDKL